MTRARYVILIDREDSGAYSAYAPGLPLFASAESRKAVLAAMRDMMRIYFEDHPVVPVTAFVRVATVKRRVRRPPVVTFSRMTTLLKAVRLGAIRQHRRTSSRRSA